MAQINPNQDYDIIYTLTFARANGNCRITAYKGIYYPVSETVYYRVGTSGVWKPLNVSGSNTVFPVTSTIMQVGHNWNFNEPINCLCSSFRNNFDNLLRIEISQKAPLEKGSGRLFSYFATNCYELTFLDIPDVSRLERIRGFFMDYYAMNCKQLTSLAVPDIGPANDPRSNTDGFMSYYAYGCTSLTSLGVPDINMFTRVGYSFMEGYAYNCHNLVSLGIPDTSRVSAVGRAFMEDYATGCYNLSLLELPKVGWFATHDVDWGVPEGRLGILKGSVRNHSDLAGWRELTSNISPNTLFINYIRNANDVVSDGQQPRKVKVYDGVQWGEKPLKRYSGTSWEEIEFKVYNGNQFV